MMFVIKNDDEDDDEDGDENDDDGGDDYDGDDCVCNANDYDKNDDENDEVLGIWNIQILIVDDKAACAAVQCRSNDPC